MPETLLDPLVVLPAQPDGPAMDRLDFTLPDFTRIAWVGDTAREVWAPRLGRIGTAWAEIEWRSVRAGIRSCAVTMASPEEFLAQAPRWAEAGVASLPVEMVGVSSQPYSATSVSVEPDRPFQFRFVVGQPETLATFKGAWDDADQAAIGGLLGYPPCCREFFRRVWVDEAMVDTTWPMAAATTTPTEDATVVEVDGPPQANILWRWMGARAVPHLPCRFDCPATVELADCLLEVGREAGFAEEMHWLLEVLSWPVEWSALHGIAEVRTPVLKVSTRTDATSRRYVVRRRGDDYPSEGARGLSFPYRMPVKLRLSGSRGFRRGLEHASAVPVPRPNWYATDNGFQSVAAMDDAHRPIVELAVSALDGRGGCVVDLGCGNGALLEKLTGAAPGIIPFGIDADAARIEHARRLHSTFESNFTVGDLFDAEPAWADGRRFALGIIMPGRLLEVGPERASVLRACLRNSCDQLLIYAYGDWLGSASLAELARQAGLAVLGEGFDHQAALATVLDPNSEEVCDGSG